MRERAIAGGMLVGLVCLGASIFAFVARNTGPCGKPETCVTGTLNPHPYTGYGYALVAIGLAAAAVSILLAARRRTAG
jgi:hypothetical protein